MKVTALAGLVDSASNAEHVVNEGKVRMRLRLIAKTGREKEEISRIAKAI